MCTQMYVASAFKSQSGVIGFSRVLSWAVLIASSRISFLLDEFELANLLPYVKFYFLCGLFKVFFQLISIGRRFLLTWMLRYQSGLPLNRAGKA